MSRHLHVAVGIVVVVVLPLASHVFGAGRLAWTMYARSDSHRLEVHAIDRDGARFRIAPSALAGRAGSARVYLTGADTWRYAAVATVLSRHLTAVARIACDPAVARGRAVTAVEVVLEHRRTLDAVPEASFAQVSCDR